MSWRVRGHHCTAECIESILQMFLIGSGLKPALVQFEQDSQPRIPVKTDLLSDQGAIKDDKIAIIDLTD